jgi:hypothetical protein
MQHVVHNRATIRVADRTDLSGRVPRPISQPHSQGMRFRSNMARVNHRMYGFVSAATQPWVGTE